MKQRPRVTFVLFAFNQEEYIREAVEGALAQTYEPLEIILSDDCSTDKTFEIMKTSAKAYKGNKNIILNKNPNNLGLIGHVNKIFNEISDGLIVCAAGDDISLPNRTSEIVNMFHLNPQATCIHSSVIRISKDGHQIEIWEPPIISNNLKPKNVSTAIALIIGASACYKKTLYDKFGPIEYKGTYEDQVLSFRAYILNQLYYIKKPLVLYRQDVGITGINALKKRDTVTDKLESLNQQIQLYKQRIQDCNASGIPLDAIIKNIHKELKITHYRKLYYISKSKLLLSGLTADFFHVVSALKTESSFRTWFLKYKSYRIIKGQSNAPHQ